MFSQHTHTSKLSKNAWDDNWSASKPDKSRQCGIHLDVRLTVNTPSEVTAARCQRILFFEVEVQNHDQLVAAHPNASAWALQITGHRKELFRAAVETLRVVRVRGPQRGIQANPYPRYGHPGGALVSCPGRCAPNRKLGPACLDRKCCSRSPRQRSAVGSSQGSSCTVRASLAVSTSSVAKEEGRHR